MYKPDDMLEQLKAVGADYAKIRRMRLEAEIVDQQEKGSALLDAARIAMFLDTDGWITMNVRQKGIPRDCMIQPLMGFVNTSEPLMDWLAQALGRLSIPFYMHLYDFSKYKSSSSQKIQTRVQLTGSRRCIRLLAVTLPFLVAKKRQGELMLEFIEHRLSLRSGEPYSDRDVQIANEVRSLNNNKAGEWRPLSSETLYQVRELRLELKTRGKIKSDLHGDMQSAAEMSAPAA